MEYLPDVYQHFERAFPHVHAAHQDLAKACYEGGPSTSERPGSSSSESPSAHRRREPSAPMRAARSPRARAGKKCATSACLP
jgi:hypothetical protein